MKRLLENSAIGDILRDRARTPPGGSRQAWARRDGGLPLLARFLHRWTPFLAAFA
jgi:hypothetical protein